MIQAFAGVILVLLMCGHALAGQDLASLFDAPCDRYSVPRPLALAIAGQESGMQPWILNIAGRTVRPATKEQAVAVSRAALAAGISFDVGVMQINSWWIRRYRLPLEVILDPPGNIQVGVWILGQEIKRHGLNWRAVASYHTPVDRNPERGRAYAAAVLRRLGGEAPSVPSSAPAIAAQRPAASPMLVKRFREVASNEMKGS